MKLKSLLVGQRAPFCIRHINQEYAGYIQPLGNFEKQHWYFQGTSFTLLWANLETGNLAWHWRVSALQDKVGWDKASSP